MKHRAKPMIDDTSLGYQPPNPPPRNDNPITLLKGFLENGVLPCRHCPQSKTCERYDPDGACYYLKESVSNSISQLTRLPHIRPEHMALVGLYAQTLHMAAVLAQRLSRIGFWDDDDKPRGLTWHYMQLVSLAHRQAKDLLLAPIIEKDLKQESVSLFDELRDAEKACRKIQD